jgi:hypothetical protein
MTALPRASRAALFPCLLAVCVLGAKPASALHSKAPLAVKFEIGRYDPDPGCSKEVESCFPKVFTPRREFKSGARVWVRVTLINRSRLEACTETRPVAVVFDNATGAEADRVPPDPNAPPFLFTAATPPAVNFCIAPRQSDSSRILEASRTYLLSKPGPYTVRIVVPDMGFTKPQNVTDENPLRFHAFRDEKAVRHTGKIESEPGQFVVVQ